MTARIELTVCSFCYKPARDVRYLVQNNINNNIAICNECIIVAQEVINENTDK